ncbi:MAG TPA: TnsD family Tn7-like transposition protein [Methylophilus sp.]|nr:TnsD family Tn7-like transposition protein [Methylophilus sp.]
MSEQLTFTSFQDDMTFYSWMGLMQLQNGTTNANALSKALTGNLSSGLRTDFPSNLSYFCQRTAHNFGNEIDIARNHTILPYYTSFKSEIYWDTSVRLMSGSSVETLKFHLGLPPSNLNNYSPLKFCPECYLNDIALYGVAYWHRVHQLPSSYLCTKHGEVLQYQLSREDGRGRSLLVLPNDQHSHQILLPENGKTILVRLSVLSEKILQLKLPSSFNDLQLQHTYRHGLKENGFLTRRGLIRASEFLGKIQKYYSSIQSVQPFGEILSTHKIANFLKLLRKPRGNHHTLEHILVIDFLFGSWELFASTYQWESQFQLDFREDKFTSSLSLESTVNNDLNEIVSRYDAGESLSSLCSEKGLVIGTVMRQINKQGLTLIKKRPKFLTQETVNAVLAMLNEGKSIVEIVKSSQLSKSTIDRICAENPGVWKTWKLGKNIRVRDERRRFFTDYLLLNNSVTASDLKINFNKEYKWLSLHDPDWLSNFLVKLNKKRTKRTPIHPVPRVDWEARDQICLNILQTIGQPQLESWERKKPQAFLRRLPKLEFKPRLEKLPKTRSWILEQLILLNKAL